MFLVRKNSEEKENSSEHNEGKCALCLQHKECQTKKADINKNIELQSHRMVWDVKNLKDHLVPASMPWAGNLHYIMLLRAPCNLALNACPGMGHPQLVWISHSSAPPLTQWKILSNIWSKSTLFQAIGMSDKEGKSQPGSGKQEDIYMDYMFELGWAGVKSSQGTIYNWVRFQMMEKSKQIWKMGWEQLGHWWLASLI